MNQIGADTKIGKNLAKQFKSVSSDVEKLEQKINQRISSESQIVRLKDQLDGVDNKIKDIGGTLQQVQFKDLDTTKFTASIQEMSTKLKELEAQLSNNMGGSFNKIIQGWLGKSDNKFGNLLDRLKIDPKELNYENFSQVFTKAMEDARARAQDLKKEIEDLTKQKEQYDRLASEAENRANFNPTDAVNQSLGKFANVNVKELSQDKIKDFQDNLTKFFQDINLEPDILEKKVQPLIDNLVNSTSSGEFQRKLAQFEGNLAKSLGMNKTNIDQLLQNTLNIDPKQFFNFDNFLDTSKINDFSTEVSNLLNNLMPDKSSDEISVTYETVFKAFTNGSPAEAIKAVTTALQEYQKEQQAVATSNRSSSEAIGQTIKDLTSEQKQIPKDIQSGNGYLSVLQSNYNSLLQKYDELKQQVEELRSQLRDAGKNAEGNIHTAGTNIQQSGQSGLAENIRLAKQYSQELESVKNAEQMVGKIEGITQRWFSVYAAVRMVTNAINSMKQTIAELDKTITEIAIVTDMSQSDLWGQMDTYTSMAREYAASISGVYKVSQLYYQQGLQTADVMALTESTLKMARISGLDYADATNYMTNAVRSFKMEMSEADKVVDVYSAIAAKSATDVSELAVAMSKTASSAEAVGSSFENTTAMMAVMIEATRESSQNIGSAMKSIISRYGELKENPSKLVDSEGEELSLNKVDTALQSVGISIHNAQGQFREFDDVIMELAEAWDTIDVNTQRYIATVMAGNRQQSRFLALVGSGERLKQLATEAADAENASQLQFLKTLDSIGAKQQQLETSLQSLYTSSGLEQFYKWILDVGNAIVTQFNDIPKLFNLPIPAILSFATTFYSLADVVTNVFGIIMNRMAVHRQQLEASLSNSANTQVQIEVDKNNQVLRAQENAHAKEEQEQERHEETMAKIRATGGRINAYANGRPADFVPGGENKQYGNVKTVNTASLGLNLASLGLGAIATGLKGSSNEGMQKVGGITGAFSRAASGAALGFTLGGGPHGAVVGAAIGGIVGAFENLNAILPSTKVQIENLTKAATDANNKALQEQAESKSLQSSIDKIEELKKARYSSVEAEEKYLEANDALAASHSELIARYDETGRAIIDLSSANNLLQESLQKSADATRDAAIANYRKAEKEKESNTGPVFTSTAGKTSNLFTALQVQDNQKVRTKAATINQDSDSLLQTIKNDTIKNIARTFLKEDISTKEVWEGLNSARTSAKEIKGLTEFDQAILDYINNTMDAYEVQVTKFIASDNKLSKTGKAGAQNYINSLLKIEAYQDKFFEDVTGSNDIIAAMLLNLFNDYNGDYTKYMNDMPSNLEKIQEQLKNAINTIGIDEFNKLIDLRKTTSAEGITSYINEKFSGFDEAVRQALLDYFTSVYNISDFTNNIASFNSKGIQDILNAFSKSFSDLSDTELLAINAQAEQIDKKIATSGLTEKQGQAALNTYLSLWASLESKTNGLDQSQRDAAEGLLQAWDGTAQGLEAIIDTIPETEKTRVLLNQFRILINQLSNNLNTTFSTLASSIAEGIKDFDTAIADMVKGVSMDKAVEYADKFGADISKFELDYSTGLFKYDDLNVLQQKYFDNLNEQITNANSYLEKYTDQKNANAINDALTALKNSKDGKIDESLFNAIKGLNREEIEPELKAYIEYTKTAGDNALEFFDWITNKYKGIAEISGQALQNAQARGALQLGDISDFISIILKTTNEELIEVLSNYLTENQGIGDLNQLQNIADTYGFDEQRILDYIDLLKTTYQDVNKNIYDKAVESVTKGAQQVSVTEANYELINDLLGTNYTKDQVKEGNITETINFSGITQKSEEYLRLFNIMLEDGITQEEEQILQALNDAIVGRKPSDVLNEVLQSWEAVDEVQARLFQSTFDLTEDDFSQIFSWDSITQTYKVDLEAIKKIIENAEKLGDNDKRKAFGEIEKIVTESSNLSIFQTIAKDSSNISIDTLTKLGEVLDRSFEELTDEFSGYFSNNGDGTYSIDFGKLLALMYDLELEANNVAEKTASQVFDKYIEKLSNISEIQTTGYTKLEDMSEFAEKLGQPVESLFKWSQNLKAYVLTTSAITAEAARLSAELNSGDNEHPEITQQLINSRKQAFAQNIDFSSLLNSVGTTEYAATALEFIDAVNDYNAFLEGLGETQKLDAEALLQNVEKGGLEAVKAAKDIAEASGKQITGDEIEAAYKAKGQSLMHALEQLNVGVGDTIDEITYNIITANGEINTANFEDLGGGKYLVKTATDLVDSYNRLLMKMTTEGNNTLEEINALEVKILTQGKNKSLTAADTLGNIANISYETLGKIAQELGIDVYKLINDLGDSLEDLGNGQIRITNFEQFANITGVEKGTEAYVNAYVEFNDAIINSQNKVREGLLNAIKNITDSNTGDSVNIALLTANLPNDIIQALNSELLAYGAKVENGILHLGDNANISEITQIILHAASATGELTERDMAEIADAIDAFLKSIADAISNGIKGTLSNSNKTALQENLNSQYGIQLSDKDFIKTENGWKLIEKSAINVWDTIREIDALQADIVFKDLSESLIANDERFESMSSMMSKMAKLTKEDNGDWNVASKFYIKGEDLKEERENLAHQKEIYDELSGIYDNPNIIKGNTNLFTQPHIENLDGTYSTIQGATLDPRKFAEKGKEEQAVLDFPYVLNMTPVKKDGTQLSDSELDDYFYDLMKTGDIEQALQEDAKREKLVIEYGVIPTENLGEGVTQLDAADQVLEQMEQHAEHLHDLADQIEPLQNRNIQALRAQRDLMLEMAQTRATSKDDSFAFMSGKLPEAMENPLTYAENWGKAVDILQKQSSGTKKGFIDARDWYNIANEMNNIAGIGGDIEMYGVTLNGELESASELIQLGFSHLESIDGGQLQVNLSELGAKFDTGALEMKGSITEGIHAMAQSQIDMLDGLIAMLETVVAMQEAFEGMKGTEDGTIDLGDIFPDFELDDTTTFDEDFSKAAQAIIDRANDGKHKELQDALKQIKIDNITLNDLLEDAATGTRHLEYNIEAFQTVMNSLYQMGLSGEYNEDDIYRSVKKIAEQSGLSGKPFTIDLDGISLIINQGGIQRIDWADKDTDAILQDYIKNHQQELTGKKEERVQQAKEALTKILQQGSTPEETIDVPDGLTYFVRLNGATTVDLTNDKGEKIQGWKYRGQIFPDAESVRQAILLENEGEIKSFTTNLKEGGNVDDLGTGGFTITGKIGAGVEIEITSTGKQYVYNGIHGSTAHDAIMEYLKINNEGASNETLEGWTDDILVKAGLKVIPEFEVTTDDTFNPTQENTDEFMKLLNGNEGINDEVLAKFGIKTGIEGNLTVPQLQEVAKLFGVKYEPTVLKMTANTDGIDSDILDLIKNKTLEVQVSFVTGKKGPTEDQPTGSTTSGTEGESGDKKDNILEDPSKAGEGIEAVNDSAKELQGTLEDGTIVSNLGEINGLVLEINTTDSDGLAALFTVLVELGDASGEFLKGSWEKVTSILSSLSQLTTGNGAKQLIIDVALTGETWVLELLKTLSTLSVDLNVNTNNGDDNQNPNKQPPQEEQPEPVLPSESGNPTSNINPTMTPPQNLQYPFVGAMGPMMPSGYVNPTMPMTAAFAPQLGIGMPQMQGAMPYGNMTSATPATPPTQEQPELDTDELEKGIEKVNEQISNISTSVDNITKAISEFTSQADAVNGAISDIGSAVSTLQSSISTFATDAGTGASNADAAAKALKGIPKEIPIKAVVSMTIEPTIVGPGGAAGNVTANITDITLSPEKVTLSGSKAKGTNLALPRGNAQTLMGELGPELYVTNGRYYVAGQGGPEFVDLPKDAIVFNHVKTRQLLKNGKTSGHGKPVTNEKNAISFATGTPGGPAMASASAALAALKQLRAMWASLLKSSAKDLGSQAGRGGGGGGDDAGKYVQPTTTTADIQRWYNWLRQIDKIEKDITYQEKLQKKYETDRVANGQKIFDTQKERLKLLDQEILRNERLADLQKSWYDNKRKELEESSYGKIFTYDENGLQQYVGSGKPGSGLGLDILEHLTKRDVRGEAIGDAATSKAQLKYLASVGFNLNDLIYNDDGTKVVKKINQKTLSLTRMPDDEDTDASELYTKLMENFWSRVDGWRDELDSLYDSYQQQLAKIEENQTKQNQIIEGFVKNELSVEKELLKAVEAREQAVIDKLQEQKDALEKANANYIKGIQKALEKERQIEQKNDEQENLTKLQRQLSILQRSGGGAAQIKQLQDQIAKSQKDMYFNDRQEEINAVQEASDKQLEKLDQQIQILTETLEYQKKNGLLWNQVREIMEGGDEFATAFYDKWVTSKSGESALNMEEDLRSFKELFQEWVGFRESKEEDRLAKEDMESIANSEKYGESNANYLEGFADDKERSAAQKAAEDAANAARDNYLKSHEDEDEASREANARAAAEKAYHESLQSSYMSTTGNKEANQQFAENYGSWLENRRISDANDFTNTETFKQNENVFKNAMQAYYLEHRNDEGVSEQELWQNAINAGQQALKEDIEENYQEASENSAQVIGGKAVSYTYDSVKGKMKKNSKITYGEGTSLSFEEAKEVPEGKKLKHYLRVAGTDNWVLANGIYTGERIYSQLAGNQAWQTWQSQNGNLAGAINGMNGYYGANGLTNTVDISDLKSGSLKFPGTQIPLENGGFATLGKNGNTVRISDFSSITFDKKNPDKKISKLGKNMTITAIQTPDMSKMENLQNPITIKTNSTIKKKLNDLLAADRGSLKNLLQYLGNYDISEIRRYAAGGMNYSTGPAWLDGTKTRPEAVLNSSQTSFLRNDLLGNSKDSLKSIVYSLQDSIRGAAIGSSSTTNNDGMVIENIDVTFSPGVISNDYDMRQASEVFKNEIVKIARKSGSRSVSRR